MTPIADFIIHQMTLPEGERVIDFYDEISMEYLDEDVSLTTPGIWFGWLPRKGSDKYYLGSEAKDYLSELKASDNICPGFSWKVVLIKTIKQFWSQFSYVNIGSFTTKRTAGFLPPIKKMGKLFWHQVPSWVWAEEYIGYFKSGVSEDFLHHYIIHSSFCFYGQTFIIRACVAQYGKKIKFLWAECRQIFRDTKGLCFFDKENPDWYRSVSILYGIVDSNILQGCWHVPKKLQNSKPKIRHLCRAHTRHLGDKIVQVKAHYRGESIAEVVI